jgi:hypothetical protein
MRRLNKLEAFGHSPRTSSHLFFRAPAPRFENLGEYSCMTKRESGVADEGNPLLHPPEGNCLPPEFLSIIRRVRGNSFEQPHIPIRGSGTNPSKGSNLSAVRVGFLGTSRLKMKSQTLGVVAADPVNTLQGLP